MGAGTAVTAWTIDPTAWTCPRCSRTRRVPLGIPFARTKAYLDVVREQHTCAPSRPTAR